MRSLEELLTERENLDEKIEELRQAKRVDAIKKALILIAEHELTASDLFGSTRGAVKAKASSKVMAKYRDPKTGATWSGRGKPPRWIADKDRSQFAI
jgi:DNA-binding protein H-NS